MRNHQQQQLDLEPMVSLIMDYSHQISNLETTHHHHVQPPPQSLQILTRNRYRQDIHVSNKTNEDDERNIFKNNDANYQVIKKPISLSCSSLAAREGETTMPPPPPTLQDFDKNHHQHNIHAPPSDDEGFAIIKNGCEVIKKHNSCSSLASGEKAMTTPPPPPQEVEESGREKLKRHRVEMAGRVWIPEIWGHEDVLKDWIDCTVFDSSLGNNNIMSARAALIQEGRSTLSRIHNQC